MDKLRLQKHAKLTHDVLHCSMCTCLHTQGASPCSIESSESRGTRVIGRISMMTTDEDDFRWCFQQWRNDDDFYDDLMMIRMIFFDKLLHVGYASLSTQESLKPRAIREKRSSWSGHHLCVDETPNQNRIQTPKRDEARATLNGSLPKPKAISVKHDVPQT